MSLLPSLIPYFAGFKFDQQEYTGNSLTVTGNSIAVKPDGTRLLVLNGRTVSIYDMSTPNDLSTASANGSISLSALRVSENLTSLRISADGLKLFVLDKPPENKIVAFTLSSAWGGSATYSTEIDTFETLPDGPPEAFNVLEFDFTDDGTRIIANGDETLSNGGDLRQVFMHRDLSTAFDLTTVGAWSGRTIFIPQSTDTLEGFRITNGGFQLVYCDSDTTDGPRLRRLGTITTANDLTGVSLTINNFIGDVSADGGGVPLDIDYGLDGKTMYVMATNTVLEYRTTG